MSSLSPEARSLASVLEKRVLSLDIGMKPNRTIDSKE